MHRKPLAGALGALLLLLLPAGAEDPKAPWAIRFTHGPLETYSVTYKDGSAKTYYYMTFALKNNSQEAAPLHLSIKATVGSDAKKRTVMPSLPAPDAEESLALAEMRRVLRPGGAVVINVGALEILRGNHSVLGGEVRTATSPIRTGPTRGPAFGGGVPVENASPHLDPFRASVEAIRKKIQIRDE